MTTSNNLDTAAELRRLAEEKFRAAPQVPEDVAALSPTEIQRTFHELRVHQIELEMQNEELRQMQAQLNAARARYFDLYDLAPVGYVTLSEQGLILEANLTAATLLGAARGALVKQSLARFIHKDDQSIYYQHRKALFEKGTPQACELRMLNKDGTSFWAQLTANAAPGPSTSSDDAPVCRIALSDISARKQAEQTVRDSEARYQALFEHSADGILIADPEAQVFKYANPAICRMLGYTQDELKTLGVSNIHPQETLPHAAAEFAAQTRGEKTLAPDIPFLRKDGTIFHADVSATTATIDGRTCLVGFFRDIAARKQAEEESMKQLDELRRWYAVTLGREGRIGELKREVNALAARMGEPPPYGT